MLGLLGLWKSNLRRKTCTVSLTCPRISGGAVFKVSMDVELSSTDLGGRKCEVQLQFDPHQGKSWQNCNCLNGLFRKLRAQQSVLHQGVWFEVCFGGMIRGYVSGYVSPSLADPEVCFGGMIRGYDSGAWFGVWFAEMQHACDHKFCIRHFWKHSNMSS